MEFETREECEEYEAWLDELKSWGHEMIECEEVEE